MVAFKLIVVVLALLFALIVLFLLVPLDSVICVADWGGVSLEMMGENGGGIWAETGSQGTGARIKSSVIKQINRHLSKKYIL